MLDVTVSASHTSGLANIVLCDDLVLIDTELILQALSLANHKLLPRRRIWTRLGAFLTCRDVVHLWSNMLVLALTASTLGLLAAVARHADSGNANHAIGSDTQLIGLLHDESGATASTLCRDLLMLRQLGHTSQRHASSDGLIKMLLVILLYISLLDHAAGALGNCLRRRSSLSLEARVRSRHAIDWTDDAHVELTHLRRLLLHALLVGSSKCRQLLVHALLVLPGRLVGCRHRDETTALIHAER